MKNAIKRITVMTLVLIILVSGINIDSYASGKKAQSRKAIKAYSKVLSNSIKTAKVIDSGKDVTKLPKNVSNLWMDQYRHLTLMHMGDVSPIYSIQDINKDGIPELFVGIKFTSAGTTKCTINAVYTYKKKVIMLFEGTGDRACVDFYKNGILSTSHYGGAGMYGYTFYKLPKKSVKPKNIEQVEADWGKFTKSVNGGSMKSCTSEDFNAVVAKYDKKKISPKWYKLNKNAVTASKKGYASYKAYKKAK